MDLLGVTEPKLLAFMLIAFRLGALFAFAPVFGSPFVPQRVKAAVVLGLAFCLSVLGVGGEVEVPRTTAALAFAVVQELVLGLLLGYVCRLVFAAVEFGGQVVGLQMGLGIVSVLDPQFETQVSIVSQFQLILASLIFLAIGGDRMLIATFSGNLERIAPGHVVLTGPAVKALIELAGEVFVVGLQISAPVVVALLATQVVLGIFARSVPQMNMLILGFPLQILIGFGMLGLALGHWAGVFLRALSQTFEALRGFAALLG